MIEITNYAFEDSLVRVHKDENGDPWFVAKDVCGVLGLENSRQAIQRLDEDEKADVTTNDTSSNGTTQIRKVNTVSESGLYSLIFTSRKPEARSFRKWVTSEVLPAIRKTGKYEVKHPASPMDEDPTKRASYRVKQAQRSGIMSNAVQIAKMEGSQDRADVFALYEQLCAAVAGPELASSADLAEAGDLAKEFVDQWMIITKGDGPTARTTGARIYAMFRVWCEERMGIFPGKILSHTRFGLAIKTIPGVERVPPLNYVYYNMVSHKRSAPPENVTTQ
ncbi:MAG: Bro-N domain-containing protein [Bacteroidales bacterium]|nr:Bro-N domain-containing protein [Bacteroidales bacterium]